MHNLQLSVTHAVDDNINMPQPQNVVLFCLFCSNLTLNWNLLFFLGLRLQLQQAFQEKNEIKQR